ncbi:MAG: DMT family transporter [Ruminococcaceae bacterium]|nr:DMT family transporter [Oscillospiraceae bacterium]
MAEYGAAGRRYEKMKKSRALALIIISSFMFATSGIFVRLLGPYGFTSIQMTAMRGIVSAITLTVFLLLTNRKSLKISFKGILLFILSGAFMFLAAFFYYTAMGYTTIATAVVLMYAAPIYVLLYSVLFLKEKLTPMKIAAVIVMLVGMALVSGIAGGMEFNFWGVFFAVLAGVAYAGYNIVAKLEMKHGYDPMTAMTYCYITMGLVAGSCADIPNMVELIGQSPLTLIPLILGIGLLTCAIPYLLYTVSLKVVPAGTACVLALIEPMAAIIYSVVFFNEPLTVPLVVGVVLILSAVFMISRIKE